MMILVIKPDLISNILTAHCMINQTQRMMCCAKTLRLCAGPEAPKEAAPDVPYAQPGLKAILADAVQWDSFQDFLALGLPGGFMMQLEGNSYDITTLLAGLLGELAGWPHGCAPVREAAAPHQAALAQSFTGWCSALRLCRLCKLTGQVLPVIAKAMPQAVPLVGKCSMTSWLRAA